MLSVIIPTYNEREVLPVLLARLSGVLRAAGRPFELLIMDDDSPDQTWELAESLRAQYPEVRVVRRVTGPRGLAPAVVEGWRQARGTLLAVIDADLQHPPELLPRLAQACDAQPAMDIVIASRYTAAGERLRWNPVRRWISRGASNIAQAVLPPQAAGVTDPMSGFFLLRRSVIEGVTLEPRGYKILLEVLSRGRYRQVAELPYRFGQRQAGHSKLGAQVMRDYLLQLWALARQPTGLGRFLRYCLIGGSGVVVNLGALWLLRHDNWLGKLRAPAVAIELAILNNFLWNEIWTFRDRAQLAPQWHARLGRLLRFNLICAIGAGLHLGLVWALAINGPWPYMATNVLAIAIVTVWNYGLNMAWTWTRLRMPS